MATPVAKHRVNLNNRQPLCQIAILPKVLTPTLAHQFPENVAHSQQKKTKRLTHKINKAQNNRMARAGYWDKEIRFIGK